MSNACDCNAVADTIQWLICIRKNSYLSLGCYDNKWGKHWSTVKCIIINASTNSKLLMCWQLYFINYVKRIRSNRHNNQEWETPLTIYLSVSSVTLPWKCELLHELGLRLWVYHMTESWVFKQKLIRFAITIIIHKR